MDNTKRCQVEGAKRFPDTKARVKEHYDRECRPNEEETTTSPETVTTETKPVEETGPEEETGPGEETKPEEKAKPEEKTKPEEETKTEEETKPEEKTKPKEQENTLTVVIKPGTAKPVDPTEPVDIHEDDCGCSSDDPL
ncbi:hypothetical protein BGZ70_002944 [Mortierella alpina]|uniref:Uncharacterized protein n=1 Tax=Mortierella alpina TaxID=64518 RepID=A0A9P6LWS7_MORAP|nr:hypothetical protein BGZ70_002944 [Mortierella alpina]